MTPSRKLGLLGAVGVALALAACAGEGAGCEGGVLCGPRLDGDGDKHVSQSEWNAAFQKADIDGDGRLSPDEVEVGGGRRGGGRR
jgi:hypothetical protein